MRKVVVYCDRCGKEIVDVFHLTAMQERTDIGDEITAPAMKTLHSFDFCFDCMVAIQDFAIWPHTAKAPEPAISMIEVDKSPAVDTPPEEQGDGDDPAGTDADADDTPHKNTPGKLLTIPNEFFRGAASAGMSAEKIRVALEQEYGVLCSAQAIRNRLHKMGL